MAAALIEMYRALGVRAEYCHLVTFAGANARQVRLWRGGDYAKLRYWRLIEERPGGPDEGRDTRNSGYWRLTSLGGAFVRREVKVPKYVFLYDGFPVVLSDVDNPNVSIEQCLSKQFKYSDLMKGV
jgi:hypothetical protein